MPNIRVNNIKVEENIIRSWIWRRRIPQFRTTVVSGDWGMGKTTAVCSMIAHIFNKEEFPDGEIPECEPGHVFFVTTESDTEELGQKLKAQGMKVEDIETYVHVLDYVEVGPEDLRTFDVDVDRRMLEERFRQFKPILTVFDPLLEFHSRKEIDSKAIRGLMVMLQQLCDKYQTTLILMIHWNKNEKLSRQNRLAGSGQYQAATKSVITVWRDPKRPGVSVFTQDKHNLSSAPPDLEFEITEPYGELVWRRVESQQKDSKIEEAKRWLLDNCMSPISVQECVRISGFSERTLKRARSELSLDILTRPIYVDGRTVMHWEVAGEHNLWGLGKISVKEPG